MGLYVNKDLEASSKLSSRITANLRSRANNSQLINDPSEELDAEGGKFRKTKKLSWFWIILSGLAGISLALIAFF